MLPDSVAVFLNVLGIPWINVDEDQVHETARHIRAFIAELDETLQSANHYMSALETEYSGQGYRQLLARWAAVDRTHMSVLRAGGTAVADALDMAGTLIAALKTVAIAEIAALFTAAGVFLVSGVGTTLQPLVAAAVRRIVLALKLAVEEYIFGELLELAVTEFEDVVRGVVEGIAEFAYGVTAAALDVPGTPPELRLDPEGARRYADAIAGLGDDIAEHYARLADNLARVDDGSRSDLLEDAPAPAPGINSENTQSAPTPPDAAPERARIPSGHHNPTVVPAGLARDHPSAPGSSAEHPASGGIGAAPTGPVPGASPTPDRTTSAATATPTPGQSAAGETAGLPPLPAHASTGTQASEGARSAHHQMSGQLHGESPASGPPAERTGETELAPPGSGLSHAAGIPEPRAGYDAPGTGATAPTTAASNPSPLPPVLGTGSRKQPVKRPAAVPEPTTSENTPVHHTTSEARPTPWTKRPPKTANPAAIEAGKPAAVQVPSTRPEPAAAVSAPTEADAPPAASVRSSEGRVDAEESVRRPQRMDGEPERRGTGGIQ
ncbi:hypothetical protein ACFWPH_30175 [Nocardia sp. NPDC058499]|uniref:WXG100 family type VII secretion target n=1 Tax=Nocardia sp. NPDC058499 TaxID=3346530 RepID=UPI003656207D